MSAMPIACLIISQQVFLAAIFAWPPLLFHSGKFLGIPVAAEFGQSPEYRALLRGWWLDLALMTLTCAAIALAPAGLDKGKWATTGFVGSSIVQAVFVLGGILSLRKKAMRYAMEPSPTSIRTASLPREPLPGVRIRRFLLLAPLALILLTALYLCLRWNSIPAHFPMHWNGHGRVNHWGTRRPQDVFAPLAIGLFCYGLIAGIRAVAGLSSLKPRGQLACELLLLGVNWLPVMIICPASILMPFAGQATLPVIVLFATIGPLVLLVAFALLYGRLSRDMPPDPPPSPVEIERMQPSHWRWGGLFYYNPDDPALTVEKKIGLGTTPNMAHKAAWIPLLLILLFALALPFLIPLVVGLMK